MKKYIVYFAFVFVLPVSTLAQVYNPTVESQRAQVQQILALVNSLPSNTNDQLTQKIQLLQQALQLQLAVNSATGYDNSSLYGTGNGSNLYGNTQTSNVLQPPYISILYPSSGNVGTRINFQGNNIAVNDQIQILPPSGMYGYTSSQYIPAGVVDPGLGFTFPASLGVCTGGYSIYTGACLNLSSTIPVTNGSYGVRIMKPDGYTVSNTQYFQISTSIYNNTPNNTWAVPANSFALTATSYNPTSVMLSWPNALSVYTYRVLEILPNNQMNSITMTSNRTYQIDNLVAGSVHTYIVYGCTDTACSQVSSQSQPVVVSLGASINGGSVNISVANTTQATNVTGTTALLGGVITFSGYTSGTVMTWFEYAVNLNNTGTILRTNQVSHNYQTGTLPISAQAYSLSPNTLYQFRLVAQPVSGAPVYSNINTFYTSYY